MLFNGKKFEMLRYGVNSELKMNTNYLTPDCEDMIEVKENLRDLVIIMSDNATFRNHVDKVCTSVKQKCGWILRTFSCRETSFMKFIWKSLVQGHVDYCSQLYMPNQTSELMRIEKNPSHQKSQLLAKIEPSENELSGKETRKIQNNIHLENTGRTCA